MQRVADELFETIVENHGVSVKLYELNSALRRCGAAFSAARTRYITAVQQSFANKRKVIEVWKKEEPSLKILIKQAEEYCEKVDMLESEREESKFNLSREKRQALRLRERIDEERERIDEVERSKNVLLEDVRKATDTLVSERKYDVEKDRAVISRIKKFVPRGSLRVCFRRFVSRIEAHRKVSRAPSPCPLCLSPLSCPLLTLCLHRVCAGSDVPGPFFLSK